VLDLSEAIAGVSREELAALLDNGSARKIFDQMVDAQGGDSTQLGKLAEIHQAPLIRKVLATKSGTISVVDAGMVGQASLQLGGGRATAADDVDFAVGFDRLVKTGAPIRAGEPLCRVHARTQADFDMAAALTAKAIRING
jgi:thymidine phosphorylase